MSPRNDALNHANKVQDANPPVTDTSLRRRSLEPLREHEGSCRMLQMLLVATLIGTAFLLREINRANQSTPGSPAQTHLATIVPAVRVRAVAPPQSLNAPKASGAQVPMATAETPTPQPAPLKLQAIVFHPTRPSAVISGKTVFVGDWVRTYCVAQIQPDGVTLFGATGTNRLTLE